MKRVLTIPEFCEAYSIGRTTAYEQIGNGRLKSFALGRKRLIASDAAESWLASLASPESDIPPSDQGCAAA